MKRVSLACVAVLLVAGSSFATNYVWDGVNGAWTTYTNWTPDGLPTTGDSAYIGGSTVTAATSISVGALRADCITGQPALNIGSNTLTVINDNGMSGNLFWRSNAGITAGAINAYGNVMIIQSSSYNWGGVPVMRLMGTNQYFRDTACRAGYNIEVYGTGAVDNGMFQLYDKYTKLTIKSGGKLGNTASTAQGWSTSELICEGGQANMPTWGSAVNFTFYGNYGVDNGIANKYTINSSVLYPNNVAIGFGYIGNPKKGGITWKVKGGDLKIRQAFTINAPGISTYNSLPFVTDGDVKFITQENGTSTWRNLTVGTDLVVGTYAGTATATPDCEGIAVVKFGNSVVRVGQDLKFGSRADTSYQPTGSGDLGNATIYLGRDLTIYNPWSRSVNHMRTINAWNAGTSTLICDGNGTSATYGRKNQTLTTNSARGFWLNNLVIHNECGTVSLANSIEGNLKLTGNLSIECGTFNDNGRPITFNGPDHHLKIYAGTSIDPAVRALHTPGYLDNIILLTNAVLRLDSNAGMDNIEMQSGSKLYLQGFTLNADGKTWVSNLVSDQGVAYESGTIYGTLGGAVPEPATLLLLGTGALGAFGYIRRRRMA